jgi:PPK2 family polyphosphate:nucleotide phosphotransferase
MSKKRSASTGSLSDLLRVAPGSTVDLASYDTAGTPGYPGKGKADAPALTEALGPEISELQERLYADGKGAPETAKSVLVVLQGMDTSGKGGTIRHVFGMVDPQGIALRAFKAPTEEERKHDFLWRITNALPGKGMIGIFDRSQYEDVLIVRVEGLVPEDVWQARYDQINAWEADVAASGTTIIKCFLHISADEQKSRLAARLADPAKHWKYNPGDVGARAKWPAYQEAYEAALTRCSTEIAPWYVVPSDRKWYRNWAVATLLYDHLRGIAPDWPAATFDVAVEKARVAGS